MSIAQILTEVRKTLPPSVRLIAVSKQVSVAAMREAYVEGVRDFAESRLQEAIAKQEELAELKDICWHFIGHLQSNKAQKVLERFDWIHTVDSLKLAQRLDQAIQSGSRSPKLCLQVKPLPDPNKYGWAFSDLLAELPDLLALSHLQVVGLMTILPLGLQETEISNAFQSVRHLAEELRARSPWCLPELSMGMSGDYPLAIAQGATLIRLGRILFGEREIGI
jgi:pyridoxal phosphate enzyme (YggS family)